MPLYETMGIGGIAWYAPLGARKNPDSEISHPSSGEKIKKFNKYNYHLFPGARCATSSATGK
jgi:hypothetical protein